MAIEYLGLSQINGSLIAIEGMKDAAYDEVVEIVVDGKQKKLGRIVACYEDKAMIQVFEDEHPDAIVTDHQLNEIKTEIQYNVSYNGAELVNAYRDIRPNFPCFVITSYDNDAISTSKDVNLVYVKILMNGGEEGAKAKFHDKMVEQIDKYKKSIDEAQSELTSLVQKKQDKGLTLHEEDRLVELDSFLEKSLDSYATLPADIKRSKSLEQLSEVIDKVDEILAKLD